METTRKKVLKEKKQHTIFVNIFTVNVEICVRKSIELTKNVEKK